MDENEKKDGSATSQESAVDSPLGTLTPAGEQLAKRRGRGAACAPPPPVPPGWVSTPVPDYFITGRRPPGWVCRRCTEFWDWQPYQPPTEAQLDEPCARCGAMLDPQERATEVNRLLLAHVSNQGPAVLTVPVPTSPTVPAQRRKGHAELLSKKEAARRLGVDRATTLEKLIASGQLKTVEINGRVRISRAEVERIITGGISDTTGPQPSRSRRPPRTATSRPSESPGAEIRKLKLPSPRNRRSPPDGETR